MSKLLTAAATAIAFMLPATAAAQQMAPGAELIGQQVRVMAANGDTNNLTFQSDGTVHITSTNGQSAHGRWYAQGSSMCIAAGSATECWQYSTPFQAGQAMTMVSDCGATTNWTALGVNQPPQPVQRRAGERG